MECLVELRESFDDHNNALEFTETYEVPRFLSGMNPLEDERLLLFCKPLIYYRLASRKLVVVCIESQMGY